MNDDASALRSGNPYGGVPSGGITLPPYYRPTPDLVNNNLSWSASDVWSRQAEVQRARSG